MHFVLLRFSAEQMHEARHDYELHLPPGSDTPPNVVHLTLDHVHMGVGGDDSWSPSVHEQYLVPPAIYSFSLALAMAHKTARLNG